MEKFGHGIPDNPYNEHAWILGNPEIGEQVWIGSFCLIDGANANLKIGRGTDISSGAQILTHSTLRRTISERRYLDIDCAPVEIGEFCFIGTNSTILMGASIGHHSVIGAGAVVPQYMTIPPYSLVAGVPAKIIGSSRKFLKGVEKESVSIVIPAFNEIGTIGNVVRDALSILKKTKVDWEIILVDDGSTDGTGKLIDKLSKENKHINAFHHKKNRGFTGAMKTCFKSANKHYIFLAPADGQFDFSEFPKFLIAIKGYDVATAYIEKNEELFIKKFLTSFFHYPFLFLCRYLLGVTLREFSTVSLWRRKILQGVVIESDDRSAMFLPELISKTLKKNYKFIEVSIKLHKRKAGEAKGASLIIAFRTLFSIFKLWFKLKSQAV